MQKFIYFLLLSLSINVYAQTDSIFTNQQVVLVNVVEITDDAVKFRYPNEDLLNSMYKNSIDKIIFKSGRIQTFQNGNFTKNIKSVEDFESVSITQLESEVKGLFKISEISSRAVGKSSIAKVEVVKERAYRKLKIEAAMRGANTIYLMDQKTEGNVWNAFPGAGHNAYTNLSGIAYTNKLLNFSEFKDKISSTTEFKVYKEYIMKKTRGDLETKPSKSILLIQEVTEENGFIYIVGKINNVNRKFLLSRFDNESFGIYYDDEEYNRYFEVSLQ